MAIQKTTTLDNGAVGSYWKIGSATLNKTAMTLSVEIDLFADKAHADLGSTLGMSKQFSFGISSVDAEGNLVLYGYTNIKLANDPDLVGGVDV